MLQRVFASANQALFFRPRAVSQPRAVAARASPQLLIVELGDPGGTLQQEGVMLDVTHFNNQSKTVNCTVGFDVLDALATSHSIPWNKKLSHKAVVGAGNMHGVPVLLCKPMTFMNVSGESVAPIMKDNGLELSQVLVVFDDLDSDFGAVKLKMKGGHGGHNGMRSIIGHLNGTHNFPRLKIGIGRPADPRVSIPDHVLGHFAGDDAAALPAVLAEAAAAVEAVAALGLEVALSGKRLEV